MLKRADFWQKMPHESLLVIQTDALLCQPLAPFFFQFAYLGAPFIPRQHSEYFERRGLMEGSAISSKQTHLSMGIQIQTCIHTYMATEDSRSEIEK